MAVEHSSAERHPSPYDPGEPRVRTQLEQARVRQPARSAAKPAPEDSVLLHGPAKDSTDRWFLRALSRLSRDREALVWVIAQAPALSRSRAASLSFPGKVHLIDMVSPVVGLDSGGTGALTCNGPTDYQQLTLHLEDLVVPGRRCLVVVDNLNGICYSDQGERVLRAMNSINNLVSTRGGTVAYLFYEGCLPLSQEEALRSVVHRRLRAEEGAAEPARSPATGLDRTLLYAVSLTLVVSVLLTFLLVSSLLR
jgi:hypothetical protein